MKPEDRPYYVTMLGQDLAVSDSPNGPWRTEQGINREIEETSKRICAAIGPRINALIKKALSLD